jgi:hypothetical protein
MNSRQVQVQVKTVWNPKRLHGVPDVMLSATVWKVTLLCHCRDWIKWWLAWQWNEKLDNAWEEQRSQRFVMVVIAFNVALTVKWVAIAEKAMEIWCQRCSFWNEQLIHPPNWRDIISLLHLQDKLEPKQCRYHKTPVVFFLTFKL